MKFFSDRTKFWLFPSVLMFAIWNPFPSSVLASPARNQGESAANVDAQTIQISSDDAKIPAYLAKPKSGGKHSAVIIVHDTTGLNGGVEAVARRFAESGFVALAPDLSRGAGEKAIAGLPLTQPVFDLQKAFAYLQGDSSVDSSKISAIGFGWGGWRVFKMAEDNNSLYRAVIFYGATPTDENLKAIHASVLGNYAQYDFRVTGNAVWTEKELGKKFTYYVYPKTDRGFFLNPSSDTNDSAQQAWTRTLDFLK